MQGSARRSHQVGRSICLLAAWSLLACPQPPPQAEPETPNAPGILMTPGGGPAIGGHDPVSYFREGRARKGLQEFSHRWQATTWLFATAEHRDLFESDPTRYAPAYGGWCAFGVAEGYAAESDPENAWTIYRGRLYLNWDAEVAAEWRGDTETLLEKSEANWPEVEEGLRDGSAEVYWHDE